MAIVTPALADILTEGLKKAGQFTTNADAIFTRAKTYWIEEVKQEIGKRGKWRMLKAQPFALNLVNGTQSYALPTDFMFPDYDARRVAYKDFKSAVYLNNGGSYYPLRPVEQNYFYELGIPTQAGTPYYYYIDLSTFKIYFWQVPNAAFTGQLFYFRNITKLDDVNDTALLAQIYDMWRDLLTYGIYVKATEDKTKRSEDAKRQLWDAMIDNQLGIDKMQIVQKTTVMARDF